MQNQITTYVFRVSIFVVVFKENQKVYNFFAPQIFLVVSSMCVCVYV